MTPDQKGIKTKFHFPGEYPVPPIVIEASTREEAHAEYERIIKSAKQPEQATSTGEEIKEEE